MTAFLILVSILLPMKEETDVLKARATAVLELVLKGSANQALPYVDDESKDRFLLLWGKGIPQYEITDVRVKDDQGQVIAKIKHPLPFDFSMDIPTQMDWVRKNGEWFLHIPDWDRTITPFGAPGVPPLPNTATSPDSPPVPGAGKQK
jgi:hypothetical protein